MNCTSPQLFVWFGARWSRSDQSSAYSRRTSTASSTSSSSDSPSAARGRPGKKRVQAPFSLTTTARGPRLCKKYRSRSAFTMATRLSSRRTVAGTPSIAASRSSFQLARASDARSNWTAGNFDLPRVRAQVRGPTLSVRVVRHVHVVQIDPEESSRPTGSYIVVIPGHKACTKLGVLVPGLRRPPAEGGFPARRPPKTRQPPRGADEYTERLRTRCRKCCGSPDPSARSAPQNMRSITQRLDPRDERRSAHLAPSGMPIARSDKPFCRVNRQYQRLRDPKVIQ